MLSGLLGNGLWNTGIAGSFLDKDQLGKLTDQANKSALLTAGLSYLAQPKTGGYGSAIPYLAQAGLTGYGTGQNVFNQAGSQALQLATLKKGMMTNLDKLIAARDALPAGDPKRKVYDDAITKETSHQPAVTVSTQVPFNEKIMGKVGEGLATDYNNYKYAPATMNSLEEAKQLAKNIPSFGGSFGQQKKEITKFFNSNLGTNINPEEVADAEALNTLLFEQVKDNLKKMDATPSQEQQRQMREAFGNLSSDPKALQKIITIQQNILAEKVGIHNQEVRKFMKNNQEAGFMSNLIVEMPEYERVDITEKPKQEVTQETAQDIVTNEPKTEINIFDQINNILNQRKTQGNR